MTKEEIIKMAKKADLTQHENPHFGTYTATTVSLMRFAKLVAEHEREKVTKERDRMCEHCKWRNDENSTLDETNQSKVLGKG